MRGAYPALLSLLRGGVPVSEAPALIDTDVHNAIRHFTDLLPYLPKAWHQQWLETQTGVPKFYFSPIGTMRKDADPEGGGPPGSDPLYLKKHHLDAYGIDYAILTGSEVLGISLHPDVDYANAVVAAYNDWLIETWLKASPQYKGSILINASDPTAAAREIDRMGPHPDMVQVLMASASRMLYGQRFYHPIYEAAERNGLPVAIHPGTEGRGVARSPTPSSYPSRYFEWHNILPTNFMAQLNSLVCEGVFEKYPKLKFVAIEGGIAWLPHLMWRMDKNYKALRDTVPWLKRKPSEYIKEHLRLTTQPIEEPEQPEEMQHIFRMIGAEQTLMFSSDYPHWDFDNPRMALPKMSKGLKQRVLAGNAMELYGLFHKPSLSGGSPIHE
jgi:predicted TIM-barrel fold metal-dependent hydrolase